MCYSSHMETPTHSHTYHPSTAVKIQASWSNRGAVDKPSALLCLYKRTCMRAHTHTNTQALRNASLNTALTEHQSFLYPSIRVCSHLMCLLWIASNSHWSNCGQTNKQTNKKFCHLITCLRVIVVVALWGERQKHCGECELLWTFT